VSGAASICSTSSCDTPTPDDAAYSAAAARGSCAISRFASSSAPRNAIASAGSVSTSRFGANTTSSVSGPSTSTEFTTR
jgi:hypothetical protein